MKPNEELQSLVPSVPEVTRRKFVVTSLSAGFALAVQPIQAQSLITTDNNGLVAGEVKIPVKGGEIPAYRALPVKGKSFPTVLVVQEIFGVHEHIKDVCRRLGKLGYLAVAPELYSRQADVSKMQINDIIQKVVPSVPDAQVLSDLDATLAWAKKNNGSPDKLAVTGFCWGGRIVWLYAAANPKLKAGVAWYGHLVGNANDLRPKNPIDVVKDLKVPVLGLYGGADQGIPTSTIEQMQGALKESNNPSQIMVYPDTPHGFYADYRPSYRREQANDAWKRLIDWFNKNGVTA
jgi:carboxymethylenebutenolidase